jgi:hypothetical protein
MDPQCSSYEALKKGTRMLETENSSVAIVHSLPAQSMATPYWQVATSANTRKAYQADVRLEFNPLNSSPSSLEAIKNGSIMSWQHINLLGEYDFRNKPASNEPIFDIEKILAWST